MRLGEVLKFKRDLAHETKVHNSAYAAMLVNSFTSQRQLDPLEIESVRNVISHMGLPSLERSEVFYMGDGVIQEYLNRSLGPEPIKWGTAPPYVDDGLMVFERPIRVNHNDILSLEYDPADPATAVIPISAVSWASGTVPTSTPSGQMIWKPGAVVMLWTHSKQILKSMREHDEQTASDLPFVAYPLTYGSAAYGGWFIPENNLAHEDEDVSESIFYNGDAPEVAAASTAVCMVHTLWQMLAEEIAMSRRQEPTSKQWKMLRRAKMKDKGVSIIQLRHIKYDGQYEGVDGRTVDWSHRWRVRGHYRRIRDRRTGQERLVWVRSHIKGPDGRPIREAEKIYSLTR